MADCVASQLPLYLHWEHIIRVQTSKINKALFWRNGVTQYNVYRKCGIGHAKTAEPIELPFGVGPRNRVDKGAHWHHLANAVKRWCAAAESASATRDGEWRRSLFPNYFGQSCSILLNIDCNRYGMLRIRQSEHRPSRGRVEDHPHR